MLIEEFRKSKKINYELLEAIVKYINGSKKNLKEIKQYCQEITYYNIDELLTHINILKILGYIYVKSNNYYIIKKINKYEFIITLLEYMSKNNEIEQFINPDKIQIFNNQKFISINDIKLIDSSLRNLFLVLNVFKLSNTNNNIIIINNSLLDYFKNSYEMTQSKLNLILKREKIQGDKAELYVFKYEKNRINSENNVRQISTENVLAGYDILSKESNKQKSANRYIEVKSFSKNKKIFITKNEIEKSKIYSNHYYIYLIDINKLNESNYKPMIIKNPYKNLIKNNKIKKEVEIYSIDLENKEED